MICTLPKLEEYMREAEGPMLNKTVSPDGRYVKFKYTEHCTYSMGWDEVTLHARGTVFRVSDGKCVLRPWDKFFNYSELFDAAGNPTTLHAILSGIPDMRPEGELDGEFTATEKFDGSLCIAGMVDGELLCTSSGSFTAWQAGWAREWLLANNVDKCMLDGVTYLFEIIADNDVHPIRYDFEGLVLLGMIETDTGMEYEYSRLEDFAEATRIKVTPVTRFAGLSQVMDYVLALPKTKEGMVVTYPSGFKMKLKGPEFLKIQKVFHSLSEKSLLDSFDCYTGDFPADIREVVPEEFKDIRDFMDNFRDDYERNLCMCLGYRSYAIGKEYNPRQIWDGANRVFSGRSRLIGAATAAAKLKRMYDPFLENMGKIVFEAMVKEWKDNKDNKDNKEDSNG